MERWILAVVWAFLPVTAGGALADATASWSTAPQVVVAVVAWAVWGAALLGIVLPRPVGLTVVRTVAPCFLVLAVVIAGSADIAGAAAALAVAATLVAQVLVARPALALLAANALAYGDESRYPLRVPPGLFLGPLPLVRLLLGAALVTGPLLLADQRWIAGAVASAVAVPVVVIASRSVHGLSGRWAVLVPAGFVVVDPLTLADPVLFPRERIATLGRVGAAAGGDDVLDLRLGASLGAIVLTVDQPAELFRSSRRRRGARTVTATRICVATVAADRLVDEAAQRRIPVVPLVAS